MNKIPKIAYFISAHGFGHASRSCAVMQALKDLDNNIEFEIFTQTPKWFFDQSLDFTFDYTYFEVDVGLVQNSPTVHDLEATLNSLVFFMDLMDENTAKLCVHSKSKDFSLVISDISILGILFAEALCLPSILIENFTWDWIYESYQDEYPKFFPIIQKFREVYSKANYHFQTQPLCSPNLRANLVTSPISRKLHTKSFNTRERLGIPEKSNMILLTMGGIPERYYSFPELPDHDTFLVIPGGSVAFKRLGNLILLPHHSEFFHPDLIDASSAVVGKAGYSTIAEIFYSGCPFGFIAREGFRESPVLAKFIQHNLSWLEIKSEDFLAGKWDKWMGPLLTLPREPHIVDNGSKQIAAFICDLF